MQRAGAAAAQWIARRWPLARRVVIACGPGNNGGDGYVCATELRRLGRAVDCIALAPAATDGARAAARAWQQAGGAVLDPELTDDAFAAAELIVDALFGIGLSRPLDGSAARWAAQMRGAAAPVVALDVPSGLDADTGAWVGGVVGVQAAATISFLAAKPGLFTADGADAAGAVLLDPLGVASTQAPDGTLSDPDSFAALCAPRLRNTHKGRFGDVQVIGGAAGMVGAALIAARAALRLGAGRVYVRLLDRTVDGRVDLDPVTPELMFRAPPADAPAVTVIGCGLGDGSEARTALGQALQAAQPCVLDADALNLIAVEPDGIARVCAAPALRVLTPHPLEAARLLGLGAQQVQRDRIGACCSLARAAGAWVVLKGAGTVIASPDAAWWINSTGSPALATAGSGDALAGMLGALLAQGFDAQSAVLGAVWLHGRAAEMTGADVGLLASEIAPAAARAWHALRAERAG
jgi:hydroxyethylthiazole kinase-like uncharacterized protein yjeF